MIRVVTEQREVEWEDRKLYWKATICDKCDILDRIGNIKKGSDIDNDNLDKKITME